MTKKEIRSEVVRLTPAEKELLIFIRKMSNMAVCGIYADFMRSKNKFIAKEEMVDFAQLLKSVKY